MTIEVKVPVLPESVEDATIATWHKKAGDAVRRDENLLDLETDKVVLEVPAPADGVLRSILVEAGQTVVSGDVLAVIEQAPAATEVRQASVPDSGNSAAAAPAPEVVTWTAQPPTPPAAATAKLSPAVRRVVAEEHIDPGSIEGSGRGGRLTKGDVLAFARKGGSRLEERVNMTRLRKRIAERMKEAQNTAAILTSFNEVDLKAVMDLRTRFREEFLKHHGVKLGLMSFFVKACCDALRKHPVVNASIDGDEIVYHNFQDVGIAVSTDRGLMVPIIRNAEGLSLAEIEKTIEQFAVKAREGTISLEDLQGGTFTITNGGVFGSLVSTPLLNPPQSAILGMHAIKDRPVVLAGEIVARPMMYLALSYDHRIVDGRDAVQFLVSVKESLEDPARFLLGL
ncbi:MAG: 2-oxoglutarate dehydrogenase complex dihydrolipoyllysine-residue succinyltransferase [Xanthomonadales bacterium]|nr:2-oxoglutarate dehydrogenase complex dihydrolipoyllysine-residue succinyltransferase [Xanthomonadales bacterium]